jgi:hypothetical protein
MLGFDGKVKFNTKFIFNCKMGVAGIIMAGFENEIKSVEIKSDTNSSKLWDID